MITIDYFSDVLCVWAYGGQIRLDELQRSFGGRLRVRHHFLSLFADTATRIGQDWQERGGFDAFGEHAREVCAQWPHTRVHPDAWSVCRPASCTTAHVFLGAAAACLGLDRQHPDPTASERFERLLMQTRAAFFEQAQDVSRLSLLWPLLEDSGLSLDAVLQKIENGEAYAALHRDEQLARAYGVLGSPTYVFNEGRQLLYGNVGYRIIESNVRELMSSPPVDAEPSWC